jgi:predicted PurR-regulated permease PerM
MLASIAIVVAALYLAKGVLVPLTLAVLVSFLLSPVCDWLERRKLGRIPAVFATVVVGFAVLGAVIWTAVVQMTELAPRVPEYQRNLQAKLHAVNDNLSSALNKVTKTAEEEIGEHLPPAVPAGEPWGRSDQPYAVRLIPSPASPLQVLSGTFGTILEMLGSTGVVILLVVFFLVRREDLRDRFVHLTGRGHLTVTTQALEDAATRVSHYLATQSLLNLSFGVLIAVGLYFIGVPNAILWGIVATILRFVPYLGEFDGLGRAPLNPGAVRGTGTRPQQLPGTLAVRQAHRRLRSGRPGGGRVLDLALGTGRAAPGDPADGLPAGARQARAATFLPRHSAGE